MYACVFFNEDSSLSVVRKNNKNVKLDGEFSVKETLSMSWGRRGIYTGTIIKIGENETILSNLSNKLAAFLETVPVADLSNKKSTVESLLKECNHDQEQKKSDQESDKVSSGKSKKNTDTPAQNKKQKKGAEANSALASQSEMIDMIGSSFADQFEISTLAQQNSETSKQPSLPNKLTVTQQQLTQQQPAQQQLIQQQPTQLQPTQQQLTQQQLTQQQPTQLQLIQQQPAQQQLIQQQPTQLQPTQQQPAQQQLIQQQPIQQQPTQQQLIQRQPTQLQPIQQQPTQQQLTQRQPTQQQLIQQQQTQQPLIQLQPTQQQSYTVDGGAHNQLIAINDQWQQPSMSSNSWSYQQESVPLQTLNSPLMQRNQQTWTNLDNRNTWSTGHGREDYLSTNLTSTWDICQNSLDINANDDTNVATENFTTSVGHLSLKPDVVCFLRCMLKPDVQDFCKQLLQRQLTTQQTDQPFAQEERPEMETEERPFEATPTLRRSPRKSPRKKLQLASPGESGEKIPLLVNSDIEIDRLQLRRAQTAANKVMGSRKGFTLCGKLIKALFSTTELAASRGLGIKNKGGDLRPILDSKRTSVIKDYVTVWCLKQDVSVTDVTLNDAFTEQVSYARKKVKAQNF